MVGTAHQLLMAKVARQVEVLVVGKGLTFAAIRDSFSRLLESCLVPGL